MIRLPTRELAMAMMGTAPGAGADRWFGALEVLLSMAAAAADAAPEPAPWWPVATVGAAPPAARWWPATPARECPRHGSAAAAAAAAVAAPLCGVAGRPGWPTAATAARRGTFIAGSCSGIPFAEDASSAEARAIRDGLILASEVGLQKLVVESDCMEVIDTMLNDGNSLGPAAANYEECSFLAKNFGFIHFNFCFREAIW
ncbi:hypothetical protein D1007_44005 [Hordeum vulgare]|nr:hypothetical protein D1007_44005 [Hordeum vulgare]